MRHVPISPTDLLQVQALDAPDAAGLQHVYAVSGFTGLNDSLTGGIPNQLLMIFQNGPVEDKGVNGLTNEVVIAVVADRLRCLEAGPYTTGSRARALAHLEEALQELTSLTIDRRSRGVDGSLGL